MIMRRKPDYLFHFSRFGQVERCQILIILEYCINATLNKQCGYFAMITTSRYMQACVAESIRAVDFNFSVVKLFIKIQINLFFESFISNILQTLERFYLWLLNNYMIL